MPLHKKNSITNVGNYRPMSVLSHASKEFESVVYNQLNEYVAKNRLIYEL